MIDDHPRPDTGHLDTSPHDQTPDMSLDNAMSIRDAAARANVTEKTVRRWIKSGRLHAVKLGGQYRITVADLETARAASPDTDVHDVQVTSTQGLDTGHDSPSVDMSERLDSGQGRQQVEPFDIKPLVDHIANLESQVQQLTEVSTMWQFRARQLEDQLAAYHQRIPEVYRSRGVRVQLIRSGTTVGGRPVHDALLAIGSRGNVRYVGSGIRESEEVAVDDAVRELMRLEPLA